MKVFQKFIQECKKKKRKKKVKITQSIKHYAFFEHGLGIYCTQQCIKHRL